MPSDVQVFVRFDERCVFAGEEVGCIITFRNVVDAVDTPTTPGSSRPNTFNRTPSSTIVRPALPPNPRARHQPSLSLTTSTLSKIPPPSHKHRRSVSIVSVKSPTTLTQVTADGQNDGPYTRPKGPPHKRSATASSLSDITRRSAQNLQQVPELRLPNREGRRSPLSRMESFTSESTRQTPTDFKFPPPSDGQMPYQTLSPLPYRQNAGSRDRMSPRTISQIVNLTGGRNSSDNNSTHSGETLMSEQPSIMSEAPQLSSLFPKSLRRSGSLTVRRPQPAMLLMGYAQLSASFTLDSSLVDQTSFEEVKRKGFLGGQAGGGVVGVKKKARPISGLFGAFNFSSLGESLDSILSGDNLSSVREMRAVTNSRTIPLLSTPQSLLFVDLHLEPGEERSYAYTYRLPKGLPSSHKGKAIRISYNLTIGMQGSPGKKEMQAVRQVNVPIRVFSGVDVDGEIFGHDLMQPYVILQDHARTKQLQPSLSTNDDESTANTTTRPTAKDIFTNLNPSQTKKTSKDFLKHVDRLLSKTNPSKPSSSSHPNTPSTSHHRRSSSAATIDTIFNLSSSHSDPSDDPLTTPTLRAITQAIHRSNLPSHSQPSNPDSSPNIFSITRASLLIGTITLNRPLHRIADTVTAAIDLSHSDVTVSSIRFTLETCERVTPELALRSPATIDRVTRKVYTSQSETTLFARRAVFTASIPASATPSFVTSGVSLDWCVRFEFATVRPRDSSGGGGDGGHKATLIEELMTDERGTVGVAVENLECESFEIAIPIVVYGDVVAERRGGGGSGSGSQGGEGKVVGFPI